MSALNLAFIANLASFTLIVTGTLPRSVAFAMAGFIILFVVLRPLEEGVRLFIRSIPLFIALPITESFDNFNTWRLVAVLIFGKWWLTEVFPKYRFSLKNYFKEQMSVETKLGLILLISALGSVVLAGDHFVALKRIVYFINLALIGPVVWSLSKKSVGTQKFVTDIAVSTGLVIVVGYVQLGLTYLIDIYQFMRLWGEVIQCNQFGNQWCTIAVWVGNTWFAYYGEQLSLRVFSLFPDSHSFPQFVLLGTAALLAISIRKFTTNPLLYPNLRSMLRTRVSLKIVWVPAAFLIAILTGTRGIWAASVGVVIIVGLVTWYLRRTSSDAFRQNLFRYISLYLVAFFLLFSVAYPIFVSPQFLLSKGDWGLFANRIRSIIDFGETSNSQRIEIWKRSLESIQGHPALGVGIGNFPVVLNQDIKLARAGSSAHNLYLQVAAEMGIPALVAMIWLLWVIFYRTYRRFIDASNPTLISFYGALMLFIPWVFAYSLTDVAIFDERTFLLLVVTLGTIWGFNPKPEPSGHDNRNTDESLFKILRYPRQKTLMVDRVSP